ncbi:MAG: hypothetical protein IJZ42_01610 [Lachnospiraceae bacterium]|nr:hypothetical protein [Lachnospiraceae bacterium]
MTNKNQDNNNAKELRNKFLILMIISACIATISLYFIASGSTLPWAFTSVIAILTFLISGLGLFTNLVQHWLRDSEESKERES